MKVIRPTAITDAILTASSIPENDYPVWNAGVTYASGARVIVPGLHRIFESVVGNNLGKDPADAGSTMWTAIGATNRWAMFDDAVGSLASALGSIDITLTPGVGIDAVALLDTTAVSARVRVIVGGVTQHDETRALTDDDPVALLFLDLPSDPDAQILVTLAGASGVALVSVGTLVIGNMLDLGITEANPSIGITDFSRRETDDFGVTTVVERGWAKRMSVKSQIATADTDRIQRRLAELRARPSIWIGDAEIDSLIIYGFYKDLAIDLALQTVSYCTLTIEGLTKANDPGSGAAADLAALAERVARLTSDGWLTPNEKVQVRIDWEVLHADHDALDGQYLELGEPGDVSDEHAAMIAAVAALDSYLANLAPAWSDLSTDTAINATNWALAWTTAYVSMANLRSAFGSVAGAPAISGDLTRATANLPATALGEVTSYDDATGMFRVHSGQTDITGVCTFSVIANPQDLDHSDGTIIHADGSFAIDSGFDDDEATASITFRATTPSGAMIDKVFALTKNRPGFDGDGATIYPHYAYANSDDGEADFTVGHPGMRAYIGFASTPNADPPLEPSAYVWVAYRGPAFGLATRGTAVAAGAQLIKNGGAPAWDSDAYSTMGYRGGAQLSFLPGQVNATLVIGLNADPLTGSGFDTIDHGWRLQADGRASIVESGVVVAADVIEYDATTRFEIIYDNNRVHYFAGAISHRQVEFGSNQLFYFDSSFYTPGGRVTDIAFGPAGAAAIVHYAYADSDDGSVNFTTGYADGRSYMGIYVDFNATDSENHLDYKWMRIQGGDGDDGAPAIAYVQDETPGPGAFVNQTWYRPTSKEWYRWSGTAWLRILGDLASMNFISGSAYIANAVIVGAHIVDLTVDTIKIKDGAITDAYQAYNGSAAYGAGFGSSITLISYTVVCTQSADLIVQSTAVQGFSSSNRNWGFSLHVNGTQIAGGGGGVLQDVVPLSGKASVAAGTHTVQLRWWAEDSTVICHAGASSLITLRRYK